MALLLLSMMDDRIPGSHIGSSSAGVRGDTAPAWQFGRPMEADRAVRTRRTSGNRAATEAERKHRIEDGVRNAKPAIEERLLPGGGVAVANAAFEAGPGGSPNNARLDGIGEPSGVGILPVPLA